MAGRGEQREGGGPFGEPLADEYGSFLPHKQFSASAVAQLKRRCSPTTASSSSSSSATTPPNDPSSHSRSLHKDKPSLPASSRGSGGGDDTAGTNNSNKSATTHGAATAGRPSSSSPLKLVQEMVSMPFGSPLVSPLRDGPAGAASPVRPGLEELSAHSPPMVVAGGEAADGDSPARVLRHRQQQRRREEAHSPTTSSPPSRERSPTSSSSSSAGEAHKRKREAPSSHDRPRRASDAAAASSSSSARAAAAATAAGGGGGGEQQHKGRGKEPEPKRVKREAGSEELLRDREAKEPRDSRERTSPRESKERRDSDPRPDLRERREQQQRHKERERARGSERSAPPKDEPLPKERTTRPAAAAAAKTTAPKPSAKPQLPFSKEGGSAGPQAAGKPDQAVGPPAAGEAHSSRGSTTTTTTTTSNGLKSEANTLKRAADKAMKTDGAHEALGLYIEAGLKYLQCCHQLEQEATEHNSPLKNAAHMYKRTAKFFDDILKIATHDKDKLRASVCHRCVGVALARAFCLKKDSMRHAQKDLQAQLKRVPVLSLPTTPDASCGSPQLTDSSPPASVSKARPGTAAADTLSSTFRQHALSFFEEMDDMFKALDAWQKAETARTEAERSGSAMAAVVFPVTLDSFLLQSLAQAPTSQVVDYVHQAINQPAHRR